MANSVVLLSVESDKLKKISARMRPAQQQLAKYATQELRKFGASLVAEAQREAPVREGKLRDSIKYRITAPNTANVRMELLAGSKDRPEVVVKSVLFGSKPHEIVPKKPGGVLVFNSYSGSKSSRRGGMRSIKLKGNLVFTRHVNHPGTKSNNFLLRAFNNSQSILDRMLTNIGRLTVNFISEGKE